MSSSPWTASPAIERAIACCSSTTPQRFATSTTGRSAPSPPATSAAMPWTSPATAIAPTCCSWIGACRTSCWITMACRASASPRESTQTNDARVAWASTLARVLGKHGHEYVPMPRRGASLWELLMNLTRIPRLIWLLLGLAVGAGAAQVRQSLWSGDFSRYGIQLKNVKTFEAALLEPIGNSRAFRSLTIYPETVTSATGHHVPVHVVAGEFNGPAQGSERGDPNFVPGQWRPAYFVAEIPYRSAPTIV